MMSMRFSTEIANFMAPSQASGTSEGRKLIYLRNEFNRYSSYTSKTWIWENNAIYRKAYTVPTHVI